VVCRVESVRGFGWPRRDASQRSRALPGNEFFQQELATLQLPSTGIPSGQSDQFQGGLVEFLDSTGMSLGTFAVVHNAVGTVVDVTVSSSVPASTASFRGLVDDDINNTSPFRVASAGDMAADTSWWQDRFEKACVLPVFNQPEVSGNNDQHASFDVHIGQVGVPSEQSATRALVAANKQSHGEPGFWVVYQLGAFQPAYDSEFDPSTGDIGPGASSLFSGATNDSEAGTVIYAETLRENAENVPGAVIGVALLRAAVSVHEIGHEFGMGDMPQFGNLMVAPAVVQTQPTSANDLQWSGLSLLYIIVTSQPGHAPH